MYGIHMNRNCFNCGKILKDQENSHIKKCNKNIDYVEARYKQLVFDYSNFDISIENIKMLYYEKEYSTVSFKKEFGLSYKQIIFLFDYYNIDKKSKDKIRMEKSAKFIKTCKEKYGSNWYNNGDKMKETCIKKYGVDNIFKNRNFIDTSISKKKNKYGKAGLGWIYETNETKKLRIKILHDSLKKWWSEMDISEKDVRIDIIKDARFKWWNNLTDLEKNEFLSKLKDNYESKLEERISRILNSNSIIHERQYWINRMSYDIKIGNVLLEINGDFWHCNPNKYSKDYFHPYIKKKASEIHDKDNIKKENAEKYGFNVFYIWEDQIIKSDDLSLLNYIKGLICN